MAATSYTITDGATSVNLADGVNYAILERGTSPAVSSRRTGWFGVGPFVEVIETVRFNVWGTTSENAYIALMAVYALLDQAERYANGENVNAVKLTYVLEQSSLTAGTTSLILSYTHPTSAPAAIQRQPAQLGENFNDLLMAYEIPNVAITFVRKGLRISTSDTVAAAGGAANPTVITKTFASSWGLPCPVDVTLSGTDDTGSGAGTIIATSAELEIQEAEVAVPAANYASVADAANFARGGNVLRYAPPDTTERLSGLITTTSLFRQRARVWAAVRNTSGHQWGMRLIAYPSSALDASETTRQVTFGATTYTTPAFIYLGSIMMDHTFQSFRLACQCLAFAGAPQLDIDYLVFAQHTPELYVMQHNSWLFNGLPPGTNTQIRVKALATSAERPKLVVYEDNGFTETVIAASSKIDVHISGNAVRLAWFCTANTSWRNLNAGAARVVDFAVTRYRAYAMPR